MTSLMQPILKATWENDDSTHTAIVQTTNADLVAWDITAARKRWPKFQEALFLWMTFCAWSALRRSGEAIPDLDRFLAACTSVEMVDLDGNPIDMNDQAAVEEATHIHPTRQGHGSTS